MKWTKITQDQFGFDRYEYRENKQKVTVFHALGDWHTFNKKVSIYKGPSKIDALKAARKVIEPQTESLTIFNTNQ